MALIREKRNWTEIAYDDDDATVTPNPDGSKTVKAQAGKSVLVTIKFSDGRADQPHTLSNGAASGEVKYHTKEGWATVKIPD